MPNGLKLANWGCTSKKSRIEAARDFWSYQPIRRPPDPQDGKLPDRGMNPIDAFIDEKLAAAGLEPGNRHHRVSCSDEPGWTWWACPRRWRNKSN